MELPTRFSRFTPAIIAIFGMGILLVPVVIFTTRKLATNELSTYAQRSGTSGRSKEVLATPSNIRKICFVRGDWIYLADLVTGEETRLVTGLDPQLSPTGDAVAFVPIKETDSPREKIFPSAQFRVLNLRTKETLDSSALKDLHVYGRAWSNDGSSLAFAVENSAAKRLDLAVLNLADGKWRVLAKAMERVSPNEAIYVDSWAPDDRSILFHTLRSLYEVSTDGNTIQQLPLTKPFQNGEISSASRFSFSSNRRYILFDRTIDTAAGHKETVSLFDLTTGKLSEVIPETVEARTPLWLPSEKEILFTCVEPTENRYRTHICKIAFDGTGLTTLIKDADHPSYSTQ